MHLNTLKPAKGSKKDRKRVGRGIGCTLGKTCGRGHKGQRARAGGFHKVGFEGGQMPLQRRLPKVGFKSRKKLTYAEVRLSELKLLQGDTVTLALLKATNIVPANAKVAKIIDSGDIEKAMNIKGVLVTKGARAKIEEKGGQIEA
jgi:large subunit ribosomal protein L15